MAWWRDWTEPAFGGLGTGLSWRRRGLLAVVAGFADAALEFHEELGVVVGAERAGQVVHAVRVQRRVNFRIKGAAGRVPPERLFWAHAADGGAAQRCLARAARDEPGDAPEDR